MTDTTIELGRWQDILKPLDDCSVDCVISDPPFSARTLKGQRSASADGPKAKIAYPALQPDEQAALVWEIDRLCRTFAVLFCDHEQVALYDRLFGQLDHWLTFAPVAWAKEGAAPRMVGDGPSPHIEWIYVARRRGQVPKRYRPGWYKDRQVRGSPLVGAKPMSLMERLVLDYSEPGWLVVDPFAGTGTTILACHEHGRRAIGCEVDATTHAYASARLAAAQRGQDGDG